MHMQMIVPKEMYQTLKANAVPKAKDSQANDSTKGFSIQVNSIYSSAVMTATEPSHATVAVSGVLLRVREARGVLTVH